MPTIKDIARDCGVSANTVSSVLNNKSGEVSARTRERILESIRRLGYRPNAAARRMVGKRMDTIGIAERYADSIGLGNHYKNAILESLLYTARRCRWDVLCYSGHPSEELVSSFPAYLDGRCDGLLCFTGGINDEDAGIIIQTGLPVIFVGETRSNNGGAVIDVDNELGAYLAVKHLLELGHSRIGMMESSETSGNAERVAGYRRALMEKDIPLNDEFLYPTNAWEGMAYTQALVVFALPEEERPTAFFCFNDMVAIGVMKAAQECSLRVPDQVSVIGFDDVSPAALATPPLSTVRQPLLQIGERAVEILIGIIDGRVPRNHRELLPPELVLRASTAPPPKTSPRTDYHSQR